MRRHDEAADRGPTDDGRGESDWYTRTHVRIGGPRDAGTSGGPADTGRGADVGKDTERLQRAWAQIDFNGPIASPALGPCWVWTGPILPTGYGYMGTHKGPGRAHLFMWHMTHGAVPDGLELDHLCRVRHCVRPDHLEPVTHRENMLRSPITGPGINARKTHCIHGHEFTPENTYVTKKGQRYCRACQRRRDEAYRQRRRARQKS